MDANTLAWLDGLYSRSFSGDGAALTELSRVWAFEDYIKVPPVESAVSRASSTVLVKIGD